MQIDITGLDTVEVLRALYNGTKPLGLGRMHDKPQGLTREEAAAELHRHTLSDGSAYFDYVYGRQLKVRLNGDIIEDDRLYDRDAGQGACSRAIASLR